MQANQELREGKTALSYSRDRTRSHENVSKEKRTRKLSRDTRNITVHRRTRTTRDAKETKETRETRDSQESRDYKADKENAKS